MVRGSVPWVGILPSRCGIGRTICTFGRLILLLGLTNFGRQTSCPSLFIILILGGYVLNVIVYPRLPLKNNVIGMKSQALFRTLIVRVVLSVELLFAGPGGGSKRLFGLDFKSTLFLRKRPGWWTPFPRHLRRELLGSVFHWGPGSLRTDRV